MEAFKVGEWLAQPSSNELVRGDARLRVEPRVMDLLVFLARQAGHVVAREEIVQSVWAGSCITDDAVHYAVKRLRQALGDDARAPRFVQTIPRRGYRLVAPVLLHDAHGRGSHASSDSLPVYLTSFLGRERELAALGVRVRADRLTTLTGPPGTGKTRLAVEASRLSSNIFQDGACFVALAPVADPALVPSAIAEALKARQTGTLSVIECVQRHLRPRHMLLLLDNFEHVATAAAGVVLELLNACPQLTILLTSRAPVRLSAEQEFPVPPLDLPDASGEASPSALSRSAAVALFVERAQAVSPGFELNEENGAAVARICIRLDGLPLALELAGPSVKLLPPSAILDRLEHGLAVLGGSRRDTPPRHQTLTDAIAWSYELLGEDHRKLLRTLSVFAGGVSLDAAHAVSRATGSPALDTFDRIAALVHHNLLRRADGREARFAMLETIREFGLEELKRRGEYDAARCAHAKLFAALAAEAAPKLAGSEQQQWLDRLDEEHDNLRTALDWLLEAGSDVGAAARLAAGVWRFWLARGHLTEGRARLATLLEMEQRVEPGVRATLLTAAGTLAHNQGDYGAARRHLEGSLALHRAAGHEVGIADTLSHLGWVAWCQSDYAAAGALSEEALSLHRRTGNASGMAHALNNLGWVAQSRSRHERARLCFEESVALRRETRDKRGLGFALTNLAWALGSMGCLGRSEALLAEAAALQRDVGDRALLAWTNVILASVIRLRQDGPMSERLARESVAELRALGTKGGLAFALNVLAEALLGRLDLEAADAAGSESLAIRTDIGDRWGVAQSCSTLAAIRRASGDVAAAVALLERSRALRLEVGDEGGAAECRHQLAALRKRRT